MKDILEVVFSLKMMILHHFIRTQEKYIFVKNKLKICNHLLVDLNSIAFLTNKLIINIIINFRYNYSNYGIFAMILKYILNYKMKILKKLTQ